jgi:Ulp1 family protease
VQLGFSIAFLQPEAVAEIPETLRLNRSLLSYPLPKVKGAVDIGLLDLLRLSNGCFLNDQMIDFYLKYLYDTGPTLLSEEQRKVYGDRWSLSEKSRFYFFNQFFYSKLTEGLRGGLGEKDKALEKRRALWERLQRWTTGEDLMSRDFMVIPINDALHWSVAIICNPGALAPPLKEDQEKSAEEATGTGLLDDLGAEIIGEDNVMQGEQDVSMRDAVKETQPSLGFDGGMGLFNNAADQCIPMQTIPVGTRVQVYGLASAAYMDGFVGVVDAFAPSTGRYIVNFGGEVCVQFAPANLVVWEEIAVASEERLFSKTTATKSSMATETAMVAQANFANGCRVRTHGFVRNPQLNDQLGFIESFCPENGRYFIVIDVRGGGVRGACMRVRAENLELIRLPEEEISEESTSSSETTGSDEDDAAAVAAANEDALRPCIIFLDSAKLHNPQSVFRYLRAYMQLVWNETRVATDGPRTFDHKSVPGFSPRVPQQMNDFDCGVYLLHFVENFIWGPPRVNAEFILQKGLGAKLKGSNRSSVMEGSYFPAEDISKKRVEMKKLILRLVQEQHELCAAQAASAGDAGQGQQAHGT